jgi:hypothetical protein
MNRCLKIIPALCLSVLTLCAFGLPNSHPSSKQTRARGFGLLIGDVKPCTAKKFDSQQGPLIVILTKDAKTFATYDVSGDAGTTWYHFDVPVGHYTLSTTWWGSKDYDVVVKLGTTSKVNFEVSCGPFTY